MKATRSAILFLVIASAAYAQMGPPPGGPPHGGPRGGAFGPGGFGPHTGKVVAGAPYSADVTNSFVRSLPDGNTIQRTTTGHVARDNDGRTYSQETITGGMFGQNGPTELVFISDPVAGYSYVLNASTKIARRRALKQFQGNGPRGLREHDRPANPHVATTELGTQMVNGVNAQGKSVTHTIPAGVMGNAQPVVSTSEIWYSPDLQVVVASKRNDPMSGQSNYALTNIQRAAPSASLFQVPSDYTVQDAPAWHGFGPRRGPGPGEPK